MAGSAGGSGPSDTSVRLLAALLPAVAGLLGAGVPDSRVARAAVRGLAGLALLTGGGIALLGARRSGGPEVDRIVSPAAGAVRPPGPVGPARAGGPVDPVDGGVQGSDVDGVDEVDEVDEARSFVPLQLTILVPARNEAAVVGGLLADLGRLSGPRPAVVVIDDASDDGTAAATRVAMSGAAVAGRVIRRAVGGEGKGDALAAAGAGTGWSRRSADPEQILVVLDADARVGPDFGDACRAAMAGGSRAATARRRMLRPARGGLATAALAQLQDDEQALDDVVQRARLAFGGAAEFRGNGMLLRADTLAALGGWPRGALCEDLELSSRLFLSTGRGVDRAAGLVVWEQPVTGLRALLRQRVRWAEGSIRRDLRIVLPAAVARDVPFRHKPEPLAYASQALVPCLVAGLAVRSLAGRSTVGLRALALLVAAYGSATWLIAWTALLDTPRGSLFGRVVRSTGSTLFAGLWLVVLPIAWLRVLARPAAPRFARTDHAPTAAFSEPEPDPPRPT